MHLKVSCAPTDTSLAQTSVFQPTGRRQNLKTGRFRNVISFTVSNCLCVIRDRSPLIMTRENLSESQSVILYCKAYSTTATPQQQLDKTTNTSNKQQQRSGRVCVHYTIHHCRPSCRPSPDPRAPPMSRGCCSPRPLFASGPICTFNWSRNNERNRERSGRARM